MLTGQNANAAAPENPSLTRGIGAILLLVLLSFFINSSFQIAFQNHPRIAAWLQANWSEVSLASKILRASGWLIIVRLLSPSTNLRQVIQQVGLSKAPTPAAWSLVCLAAALAILDLFLVTGGWALPGDYADSFSASPAFVTCSFFYLIALSPFAEEVTLRGFLYPAFRRHVGGIGATMVTLAVAIYFHWGLVSRDLSAFLILSAGAVFLCSIRETTGSIWTCVLFHSEFNAVVVRNWPAAAFILLISIYASLVRFVKKQRSTSSGPRP